ncbi:MAG: DUF2278 family protein [Acidimicrobiales bacterium]
MTVPNYGVLKGKALAGKLAGKGGKKPHFQIHIRAVEVEHRIAVNVVSDQAPSELLFLLVPDFAHPLLARLPELAEGFTPIPSEPAGLAVDFVRDTLFQPTDMKALPYNAPGTGDDLGEIFSLYVQRAVERGADLYAFGSRWGPEDAKPDEYFGFAPGNGIHDIHFNQGSPPPHEKDNGVWQDGALFVNFPADGSWLGFFLAFQSQFAHTDEHGNPIPGSGMFGQPEGTGAIIDLPGMRIVAALVNPGGDDPGQETVTLLNTGRERIDLAGWTIVTGAGPRTVIDGPAVAPGDAVRIALPAQVLPLPNRGGTITLLNPDGLKVHGVAYTGDQARAEGCTVAF